MRKMIPLLLMVFLLLTFGCATTSTMRNVSLDNGIPKIFVASLDLVLKATQKSVTQSGLQVEEITQLDDETWIIIGNKDTSAWSWGELVRVTVQKKSETETLVRVFTKRKLATNITAKGDYSQVILSNIDLNLR